MAWVGCWAHARRKFFDALGDSPKAAQWVLRLIGRLYALESQWDKQNVGAKRAALRTKHFARPLYWLQRVAVRMQTKALPKSALGLACTYLLNQWAPLSAHLQYSQTRLDNNLIENAIRPSAIGKKNWLFIGHPEAGQRSAILYSLIVSCERHGKNPHAYLSDVLKRLPGMTTKDDLAPLLPASWKPPASPLPVSPL